jgi:excisionase family DNA binding protein
MNLLTVDQVKDRLAVSKQSIYLLAAQGLLPCIRIGTRRGVIRFTEEDVEKFIDHCRSKRRVPASRRA